MSKIKYVTGRLEILICITFCSDPLMNNFKSKPTYYLYIKVFISWHHGKYSQFISQLFCRSVHSIDTACDMSHQITNYLTVCSIHADIKRSHYWLSVRASVIGFPQRRTFKLNSVNSSPNLTNVMCLLYWNDTFAIEYPCNLHAGPSVILCLIDIEHIYGLIQFEYVVLILFWYRRIGITGVNFYAKVLLNPRDPTLML